MRVLSILILNFYGAVATAGPICPNLHRDLQSDAHLHLATIIGEEDNRETFADYARKRGLQNTDVEDRYAATGVFHCGGYSGGANLVHKNNRLVLSAHQFFEEKSCTKKMGGNFSSCYFEVKNPGTASSEKYYLNLKTLKLGTQCPLSFASEDWAVVDLIKDVKTIKPYRVNNPDDLGSSADDYENLIGQKIVTVARRNANFKNHPYQTSSLCDGEIGGVQGAITSDKSRKDYFIATNCSWGHGNSGGGVVLQSEGAPTLIGIMARGIGKDYQPFGPENYLGSALIAGKLYRTIVAEQER